MIQADQWVQRRKSDVPRGNHDYSNYQHWLIQVKLVFLQIFLTTLFSIFYCNSYIINNSFLNASGGRATKDN